MERDTIDVESVNEMDEYINDCVKVALKGVVTKQNLIDDFTPKLIQKKPFYFGVAAVSDYKVKYPQNTKLKKENIGDEFDLRLIKTKDILANISNDVYKIGFKAEYDKKDAKINAKKALKEKNLDTICLNLISEYNFGSKENGIEVIFDDKTSKKIVGDKLKVAFALLNLLEQNFKYI